MTESHDGGCLCGAVRFAARGPARRAFVCHCGFCQRASGSAFQIPVFFLKSDVAFSGAALATYEYRSPVHGRAFTLQFCPRCATRVGFTVQRNDAVQVVLGGAFDDPNWFAVTEHIFVGDAVDWMVFPADVPCYARHVITEDGAKEASLETRSAPWRKADLRH